RVGPRACQISDLYENPIFKFLMTATGSGIHVPVMLKEVLDYLNLKKGGVYVDGTFDKEFSDLTQKDKIFLTSQFCLINDNFANLEEHLKKMGIQEVDGFLFDLGLSSDQLAATERGFSYRSDSPLDMRISQTTKLSAADIINDYPEAKLADIFYHYGEERKARPIARKICYWRKKEKIVNSQQL
ncbi:17540_t:CDS:2, partial [Racocetra persica]